MVQAVCDTNKSAFTERLLFYKESLMSLNSTSLLTIA